MVSNVLGVGLGFRLLRKGSEHWSWVATAWGLCVAAWTMALIARMMFGPVAWVRLIWRGGLDGAVIMLTFLAIVHIVSGVARVLIRH